MDNRYLAQIVLPEIGSNGQAKLAASKVLVIGCGGLAAVVLPYLVAAGVGNITIMDDDIVSLSNLNRQILFKESDIGLSKASVVKRELELQNPRISITAILERFDLANGLGLTQAYDLVIDCSDRYSSKVTINYCCIQNKTPLVFASVLGWDGQVALLSMQHTDSPCYKCWQDLAPQGADSCVSGGVLGVAVSIVGSCQAQLALQYLLGYAHNANFLFVFDLWSLQQKKFKLKRRQKCKFHSKEQQRLTYISYPELDQLESYFLLDIRTLREWELGHLPGAEHTSPGKLLNPEQYYLTTDKLVIYCNQELLSELVAENLQSLGYQALVLKGGYSGYRSLAI